MEEAGIDPQPLWTSPIEGLILDLPGDQRRVVSIAKDGVANEGERRITEAGVRGHVLALRQTFDRHRRCRDIELRPAESLHADGEDDRLPGSLRLAHQPVELPVAVLVDLAPVGTGGEDAEM